MFRQPPTFPSRLQLSIIGRIWLNRRVRDGYGCFPITHRHRKVVVLQTAQGKALLAFSYSFRKNQDFCELRASPVYRLLLNFYYYNLTWIASSSFALLAMTYRNFTIFFNSTIFSIFRLLYLFNIKLLSKFWNSLLIWSSLLNLIAIVEIRAGFARPQSKHCDEDSKMNNKYLNLHNQLRSNSFSFLFIFRVP